MWAAGDKGRRAGCALSAVIVLSSVLGREQQDQLESRHCAKLIAEFS
jgi:hypothetical protein